MQQLSQNKGLLCYQPIEDRTVAIEKAIALVSDNRRWNSGNRTRKHLGIRQQKMEQWPQNKQLLQYQTIEDGTVAIEQATVFVSDNRRCNSGHRTGDCFRIRQQKIEQWSQNKRLLQYQTIEDGTVVIEQVTALVSDNRRWNCGHRTSNCFSIRQQKMKQWSQNKRLLQYQTIQCGRVISHKGTL